jgi:hypothetical protein
MMFVIKNKEKFVTNKDYYELKTTQDLNLHMHQVNVVIFSKGVYHMVVKVYNGLPYTLFFICAVGLWVLRPLLTYCTSPR